MHKKFFFAVLAYFFISFFVAMIWHMVLFHDQYVAMGAFTRSQPLIPFGLAALLFQGLVFSYFYPLYYRHKGGGNYLLRGIQFCLFLGLTVYTVMVFATVAKFQIEPIGQFFVLGTAFQILQFTLVGIGIGAIYGNCQTSP